MTLSELGADVVILSCAISAGIHGALVGQHFDEGVGPGAGFLVATVLLAALAVALTRRPAQLVLAGAALVLAGLLASYALAVTTGLPVLQPERESVDALALVTKTVEAIGLLTAATLLRRPSLAVALFEPKGTPT